MGWPSGIASARRCARSNAAELLRSRAAAHWRRLSARRSRRSRVVMGSILLEQVRLDRRLALRKQLDRWEPARLRQLPALHASGGALAAGRALALGPLAATLTAAPTHAVASA